jgi:hypothetical protein
MDKSEADIGIQPGNGIWSEWLQEIWRREVRTKRKSKEQLASEL